MWCISHRGVVALALSCTVPEQCWVPSVRTEVVVMATVAALADLFSVRRLFTVIDRSPENVFWKLWYPPSWDWKLGSARAQACG